MFIGIKNIFKPRKNDASLTRLTKTVTYKQRNTYININMFLDIVHIAI